MVSTEQFNLNYRSQPNWLTYSRLIAMSRAFHEKLEPLGVRDMIDVQSFIWLMYCDQK